MIACCSAYVPRCREPASLLLSRHLLYVSEPERGFARNLGKTGNQVVEQTEFPSGPRSSDRGPPSFRELRHNSCHTRFQEEEN